MRPRIQGALALLGALGLSAGSAWADDALNQEIRRYIVAHSKLRPALELSSQHLPADCTRQWELPFITATSEGMDEVTQAAWLKEAHIDTRAGVIARSGATGPALGDKIIQVGEVASDSGLSIQTQLQRRRDAGQAFTLRTADGKSITVQPFAVCQGRTAVAAPSDPAKQGYHWLGSTHPSHVFSPDMSPDEALWVTLWSQSLATVGENKMKAYEYAYVPMRNLVKGALLLSGIGNLASAAQISGAALANEARSSLGSSLLSTAAQAQSSNLLFDARQNREELEGVSWVAGTHFEQADSLAYRRLLALGGDPEAPAKLHRRLASAKQSKNAFVFDSARLAALQADSKLRQDGLAWAGLLSQTPLAEASASQAAPRLDEQLAQIERSEMPHDIEGALDEAEVDEADETLDNLVLDPMPGLPLLSNES